MSAFEELDWCETELGELILRRRTVLSMGGIDVFEVKLDGEFLMSSVVRDAEIALSDLALSELALSEPALSDGAPADADAATLDVLVGGLGLGYTAHAALQCPRVRSVTVVERLAPVLEWHRRGLVPLGETLIGDPRCQLLHGDFFELVLGADEPLYHAILVDIDHAPHALLHPEHAPFYQREGLLRLRTRLHPGGVFGLWSSTEAPGFCELLGSVLQSAEARTVRFDHVLLGREETNVIYLARAAGA